MPNWVDWLVMSLALAYLVIAITETEGPFNLFEKARQWRFVGKVFECPICASLWLGLLVLGLNELGLDFLLYALALAGVFVLGLRLFDTLTLPIRDKSEKERIENADALLSALSALDNESLMRAIVEHYLGGVDLATAVYLGMRKDEKQDSANTK